MRRRLLSQKFLLVLFTLSLATIAGISGCGETYPESLEYPVRDDPVVLKSDEITKMIELPTYPDPLGVLPVQKAAGFTNERLQDYWDKQITLAEFYKQGILIDSTRIGSKYRRQIEFLLNKHFGTPAHPKVDLRGIKELSKAEISEVNSKLKLGNQQLAEGSRLYRLHCLHCHGLSGNGRGTTAQWVNPHPRDYRLGWFKFISSDNDKGVNKPLREDLMRTLRDGVEGTSMPSFRLLDEEELDALVSYVIHLSIRGQAENLMMSEGFTYNAKSKSFRPVSGLDIKTDLPFYIGDVTKSWLKAQDFPIQPVTYPYPTLAQATAAEKDSKEREEFKKSVDNGHRIFIKSCGACHEDYGRKAKYKVDLWGTMTKPADLTQGIYRGGSRPVDIYYRIHSGIFPSGMAPVEATTKLKLPGQEKEQDIAIRNDKHMWDVVNFVRVLPYRGMLRKLVPEIHEQIYGPGK